MKYLGLDIGARVVGVAESDSGIVASPLPAISMDENFLISLSQIFETEKPAVIVFGIPQHQDGTENALASEIRRLAEGVKHEFGVEVDFIDEYGTTKEAEIILKKAGVDGRDISKYDDSIAATLILERYFQEKNISSSKQ